MKHYKFLISGGGTGGHIYPAIAIANALQKKYPDAEFLFVGAKDKMEMEKVPAAGYTIKGLWISGFQRQLTIKNLMFPFKLISSTLKAFGIVRNFKPTIAIGTGGFASGPTLFAAARKGIPTLIQEQNSYPGITNKLLSKNAKKVCVAYDRLERFFPKEKIIKTGNPVRQDLLNTSEKRTEALSFFNLEKGQKTLLVLGGSLGARRVNHLIEEQLPLFDKMKVQVLWQCGKLYFEEYKKYSELNNIQVFEFIREMDFAYAAADMIISRAGASSVSELCIVGKPVIFIPSPNVAEDHQTKNAKSIVDENAALMIAEKNLDGFEDLFVGLVSDENRQKELSKNIKSLALPNATDSIVNEIEKLIQ
jgi:UDP-N-acetylglucosamine--N-acetylmuramyl-(pentapeptide) pyrophosphoryl-undecaprenol N-acetylglucosamine transferase